MSPVTASLLVCFFVIGSLSDIVWRRIPNSLVAVVFVTGVSLSFWTAGWSGAVTAVLLALLGLSLWLPLYVAGRMGAGDIKLFAACSAWLFSIMHVLIAAAATAIAGGVLAL